MNKAGPDESVEYALISNTECADVNCKNDDFIILLLNCCQQVITINMVNDNDKTITMNYTDFYRTLTSTLIQANSSFSERVKLKVMELLSTVSDYANIDGFKENYMKVDRESDKKVLSSIFTKAVMRASDEDKDKPNTTYEIFKKLIQSYKESQYYHNDVEHEMDSLIELIMDADTGESPVENPNEKNRSQQPAVYKLNIQTFCHSLTQYLEIYGNDSMENPSRCRSV